MTPTPTSHPLRARHSIRWRFTLWLLLLLIGCAGAAFLIVYRQTSNQLSGQINHDLRSDVEQLSQSLRLPEDDGAATAQRSAARYLSAQPFRASATLLFLLRRGHAPVSNYPEVFAPSNAPDDGEPVSRQAAENRLTARIRAPQLGYRDQPIVDVGWVRTLERAVTIDGRRLVVGAGEPLRPLTRAKASIVHSFLLAGAVLGLAVLAATLLIGRFTAPLRRMAQVASAIDAGDLSSRVETPPDPHSEIGVLAASFNHMLDRLERGVAAQREFVADASHELRTPLTVIQGQVEVLAARPTVEREDVRAVARLVRREVSRMRRMVDELLVLAQSERPGFLQAERISVGPFLAEIWDSATLIAEREFELGAITDGTLIADPDRLAQAIRNLINNAIDHTTPVIGTIRLDATAERPGRLRLRISDDGAGIPPEQLERIFNRFHRIDSTHAPDGIGGSGLGLSIVRAIIQAHDGQVSAANRTDAPGAVFEIVLPRFEPAWPDGTVRTAQLPGAQASTTPR